MGVYEVKYRKTSPFIIENIEADSREGAIQAVLDAAAEGEQVEVFAVPESLTQDPPGGVTGATGATGGVLNTKPNRAQLNEMSKDELLAVADKEGAEVAAHWNKADIVDAIVKHKRA